MAKSFYVTPKGSSFILRAIMCHWWLASVVFVCQAFIAFLFWYCLPPPIIWQTASPNSIWFGETSQSQSSSTHRTLVLPIILPQSLHPRSGYVIQMDQSGFFSEAINKDKGSNIYFSRKKTKILLLDLS